MVKLCRGRIGAAIGAAGDRGTTRGDVVEGVHRIAILGSGPAGLSAAAHAAETTIASHDLQLELEA